MKIVFLLRTGIIEWEIPQDQLENFNFVQTAVNTRLAGYFIGPNVYIRHSELIGMSLSDGKAASPFKPAGSTMQ